MERPTNTEDSTPASRSEGGGDGPWASRASSVEYLRRRYSIREDAEGRYLTCIEAPNVAVRIERGLSVSAAAVKRAPQGTIYLDGVAAAEPFMDVQRRVYNLDHHEACVRPFTLATCEQAMVLVLLGLDLKSGEWTVWANEPDLDTVLAIWVLLNHVRLADEGSEVRRAILPLLRLEGAIDANGLRFAEICGFPKELQDRTMAELDDLRAIELEQKQSGKWSTVDFLEHTARVLHAVDACFYSPHLFAEAPDVEELLRVPISDQRIAVICRSEEGIYEVEKGLLKLHGKTVGLIALQKGPRAYTLRQVDPFLPISLQALYERLNLVDPLVEVDAEENRWGGSAEIGGSPRRTGTGLTPAQIADVCAWVYQQPTVLRRAGAVARTVGVALAAVALAVAGGVLFSGGLGGGGLGSLAAQTKGVLFNLVLSIASLGLILVHGLRHRRQFGLRWPTGWRWALFLLPAILVGLVGGAWVLPPGDASLWTVVTFPVVCEALLRGVVQGRLVEWWNIQRPGGRWFISVPAVVSALASATLSALLFLPQSVAAPGGPGLWIVPPWLIGALVLGAACAMARERSGSLLPPIVVHLAAALWSATLPSLL